MGKDLKGKELGTGISQRKDGYYVGRYTTSSGKRKQKVFRKLQECRRWVANAEYDDRHRNLNFPSEILVSEWYKYWIGIKERSIRESTVRYYKSVYKNNIEAALGDKVLAKVTSIDCQLILNNMADNGKKSSTIRNAKLVLGYLFEFAFQNDLISKNPCGRQVEYKIGQDSEPRRALTLSEQKTLCESIVGHRFEYVYKFALQTGLRVSELVGLKWEDVDWEKKNIRIQRSLKYDSSIKGWKLDSLKSKCSFRTIPLTNEAMNILRFQEQKNKTIKIVNLEWKDYVFLRIRGLPLIMSNLDSDLSKVCAAAGIRSVSMHILRHTFATRCIEGGMLPKTLQTLMGHADITTTMNLYVNTTDDQSEKEIRMVENALLVC